MVEKALVNLDVGTRFKFPRGRGCEKEGDWNQTSKVSLLKKEPSYTGGDNLKAKVDRQKAGT